MDQTSSCILLLLSLLGCSGKYVYVKEEKTWLAAWRYCLWSCTDLAPVSARHHIDVLMKLAGNTSGFMWVGMIRNPVDRQQWFWSGGGSVSAFFWAPGEPKNGYFGALQNSSLYAVNTMSIPFFCYRVFVVREKKTWEEAWRYCRKHHNILASVGSEAEMLLIQRELTKGNTTEHVWIGLHFFPGDGWLWADKEPLHYEAWGSGGKPGCPRVRMECAALKVNGSSSGTENTNISSVVVSAGEQKDVWESHDCEEKLHFICY